MGSARRTARVVVLEVVDVTLPDGAHHERRRATSGAHVFANLVGIARLQLEVAEVVTRLGSVLVRRRLLGSCWVRRGEVEGGVALELEGRGLKLVLLRQVELKECQRGELEEGDRACILTCRLHILPAADLGMSNWNTDETSGLAVPLNTVPYALFGWLLLIGMIKCGNSQLLPDRRAGQVSLDGGGVFLVEEQVVSGGGAGLLDVVHFLELLDVVHLLEVDVVHLLEVVGLVHLLEEVEVLHLLDVVGVVHLLDMVELLHLLELVDVLHLVELVGQSAWRIESATEYQLSCTISDVPSRSTSSCIWRSIGLLAARWGHSSARRAKFCCRCWSLRAGQ